MEILKALRLIAESILLGTERAINAAKGPIQTYLRGMLWLALLAIIPPIPFVIYGVYSGQGALVATASIWCAFFLFALSVIAAPLGLLLETLFDKAWGVKVPGSRYIDIVNWILLSTMFFGLVFAIVPLKNQPAMAPTFLLAMAILWLTKSTIFTHKVIVRVATIVVLAVILSSFFPAASRSVSDGLEGLAGDIGVHIRTILQKLVAQLNVRS